MDCLGEMERGGSLGRFGCLDVEFWVDCKKEDNVGGSSDIGQRAMGDTGREAVLKFVFPLDRAREAPEGTVSNVNMAPPTLRHPQAYREQKSRPLHKPSNTPVAFAHPDQDAAHPLYIYVYMFDHPLSFLVSLRLVPPPSSR